MEIIGNQLAAVFAETGKGSVRVACESCGEVFADVPFLTYLAQVRNRRPCEWYRDAALHWLDERDHSIRVVFHHTKVGFKALMNISSDLSQRAAGLNDESLREMFLSTFGGKS